MADKRKAVVGGPLTHTLQVWPTDEVIAHSAFWPAWWHPAYERAARQLADGVACCILGGLPDCPEPIRMELQPSGSLTFSVHHRGTTIEVLIWHFEGPDDPEPDAPGPDGGMRRRAADGLVLGLRGTGKEFSVARFYDGLVEPVPVGSGGQLRPWTARTRAAASWVAAKPRMAPPKAIGRRASAALMAPAAGLRLNGYALAAPKKPPAAAVPPEIKRRYRSMCATPKELRASSALACLGSPPFSFERAPALSDPVFGAAIRDLNIHQGKSASERGARPRGN